MQIVRPQFLGNQRRCLEWLKTLRGFVKRRCAAGAAPWIWTPFKKESDPGGFERNLPIWNVG